MLNATMLDFNYALALRNATNAWAQRHVTDALTMRELRRVRSEDTHQRTPRTTAHVQRDNAQPALAREGSLGTRLNLFA